MNWLRLTARSLGVLPVAILALASCDSSPQPHIPGGDVSRPQERIVLLPGIAQPVTAASAPYQNDTVAINTGKLLYAVYNCAGCHAPEGGGGMGPPFTDAEWLYGSDPHSVFETIMEGRPKGMPTWQGIIPEEEVWRLVAYVRSLSPPTMAERIPPVQGGREDSSTAPAAQTGADTAAAVRPDSAAAPSDTIPSGL